MQRQFKANTKKTGSVPDCGQKRQNGNGCRIDAGTKNTENGTDPSKQKIRYAIDNRIGTDWQLAQITIEWRASIMAERCGVILENLHIGGVGIFQNSECGKWKNGTIVGRMIETWSTRRGAADWLQNEAAKGTETHQCRNGIRCWKRWHECVLWMTHGRTQRPEYRKVPDHASGKKFGTGERQLTPGHGRLTCGG